MRQYNSEAEVLQYLMQQLQPHQDILRYWRVNTGAAATDKGFIKFGHVGAGDVEGILSPYGKFFSIEVKTKVGKQRDTQKNFERTCWSMGGIYLLCRGKDEVQPVINRLLTARFELVTKV